jgi:hypothetical protein
MLCSIINVCVIVFYILYCHDYNYNWIVIIFIVPVIIIIIIVLLELISVQQRLVLCSFYIIVHTTICDDV